MNARIKRVRKVRRLKPWVKKTLCITKKTITLLFIIMGIVSTFKGLFGKPVDTCKYDTSVEETINVRVIEDGKIAMDQSSDNTESSNNAESSNEIVSQKQENVSVFQGVKPLGSKYRMTYYYPGDDTNSGSTTASGKGSKDFQLNENGWYTYNGKLVVATASKRLLSWDKYKNSTEQTYNLYDELVLTINGIDYDAVVMDVCGACMKDTKIDLFVKDKASGLDTTIDVRRK